MICIRKSKISDLERLMQMETKLYNFQATKDDRFKRIETISKSAVEDEIKNLDLYFVISDEHYVFGFIKCIEKEIKETELVNKRKIIQVLDLFIEEEYRNKGNGKKLIQILESIGREKGFDCIEIPVYCFNENTNRFYTANGYEDYVVRKFKKLN